MAKRRITQRFVRTLTPVEAADICLNPDDDFPTKFILWDGEICVEVFDTRVSTNGLVSIVMVIMSVDSNLEVRTYGSTVRFDYDINLESTFWVRGNTEAAHAWLVDQFNELRTGTLGAVGLVGDIVKVNSWEK